MLPGAGVVYFLAQWQYLIWAVFAFFGLFLAADQFPYPTDMSVETKRAFLTGELMLPPILLLQQFGIYSHWSCGAVAGITAIYSAVYWATDEVEQKNREQKEIKDEISKSGKVNRVDKINEDKSGSGG